MRLFSRLAVVITTAFIILLSASCGTDTPGLPGGVTLPPVVTLNSGAGLVSFNQELPLSSPSFTVNISGEDGDATLRDLAVLENGTLIPANQLNFLTGQTANNPILTVGADANGFTYEMEITPSNAVVGDVTFSFRLTDTDGETASTQVTITYTQTGPTVDLLIEDGFVSGDVTITNRNPSFNVKLRYDDTADSVTSISVLEDGVLMSADALTYNAGAFTAMNPLSLLPAEQAGGTFDINLKPVIGADGSRTYTFRATDKNGVFAERSIVVTYVIPAGTATTFAMGGVFFNASGAMLGGLDLDNGTAVAFNSPNAEIEDEGIDLNSAGENWRTQISATNDAVLKIANLSGLGDGVTFDDIDVVEDIEQLFADGAVPGGNDNFPDADGDVSATEIVTAPLQEGDVLVVSRATRTYLVRIDAINFAAGSNNDSYTVSIKY